MNRKSNQRLLRCATTVVLLLSALPLLADTWLKDPTRDCRVWTDADESEGQVVTWSGSCVDGKASGLGVMVASDSNGLLAIYNGEMIQGKSNGFGTIRFRNDDSGGFNVYVGGWEDNKPMGNGIFESSEGWQLDAWFEGAFDTGDGTLTIYAEEEGARDAVIRGTFKDGELEGPALAYYETEGGEIYFGDIENSQRHGVGTLVHANDDSYFGDFENGVASGTGVYESTSGATTVGYFKSGAPNGAASVVDAEGNVYQGIFTDGVPDGVVLVTRADGTQSTETWKDGEKQE